MVGALTIVNNTNIVTLFFSVVYRLPLFTGTLLRAQ